MANQDPETTREVWESGNAFSRYRLNFRGVDNVPDRFTTRTEFRSHQGITGYYAEPYNFPSAGPVAVEFNFEHLCWVEVRWRRTDNQWEAFRPAAADLQLDIRISDLTEEETRQILPISDSEGEEVTQSAFTAHREPLTSPPSVVTHEGRSTDLPEEPETMTTQTLGVEEEIIVRAESLHINDPPDHPRINQDTGHVEPEDVAAINRSSNQSSCRTRPSRPSF